MLVTLVTPENREDHLGEMDEIFKLRHEIFNKWLGWGLPDYNGREYDKYDNMSYHMIATDDDHEVVGTWRMMPTTVPYMTAEIFPELLEEIGPVSAPEIWDLSRFAISRTRFSNDKEAQQRLIASLASAIYEFGMMNGVTEYLSVQNSFITPLANQMLGEPIWHSQTIGSGLSDATCYSYTPSLERLYTLRAQYQLRAPVLAQFQISANKAA